MSMDTEFDLEDMEGLMSDKFEGGDVVQQMDIK
jgi:hypothetical protein